MHRGDAVEREESEPDASRVRLLAFFPSRATGSSGKEDDDVVRLSLSLSRSPSTSPPVSHDGSLRLPDLLRVPTRRGFPNGISLRCKYTTSPFCFFSMCNADYSFVEPQGEPVSIFVLECASGDMPGSFTYV